jgi:hypothetical protein
VEQSVAWFDLDMFRHNGIFSNSDISPTDITAMAAFQKKVKTMIKSLLFQDKLRTSAKPPMWLGVFFLYPLGVTT